MVALLGRSFTSGAITVAFSARCYGCTTPRISEYLLQTFKGESTTHLLFKSPGPGTSSSSAHISLIRSGHLTRPALKTCSTARVYFIHHQFHFIQGREHIFGVQLTFATRFQLILSSNFKCLLIAEQPTKFLWHAKMICPCLQEMCNLVGSFNHFRGNYSDMKSWTDVPQFTMGLKPNKPTVR